MALYDAGMKLPVVMVGVGLAAAAAVVGIAWATGAFSGDDKVARRLWSRPRQHLCPACSPRACTATS